MTTRRIIKYQKARLRIATAAMPPTTPPMMAPVFVDLETGEDAGEELAVPVVVD